MASWLLRGYAAVHEPVAEGRIFFARLVSDLNKDASHPQALANWTLRMPSAQMLHLDLSKTKSAPDGFFCLTLAPLKPDEPAPEIPALLGRIDALLAAGGAGNFLVPMRLPVEASSSPISG
jgi:hypothetical protein